MPFIMWYQRPIHHPETIEALYKCLFMLGIIRSEYELPRNDWLTRNERFLA